MPYGTVGTHLKNVFFGWAIHSKERFTANFPEKIVSQTDWFGKTQNRQAIKGNGLEMASKSKLPLGLKAVLGILGVELSVLIAIVVTYVVATLAGEVRSLPTMLALAALGLILAVWLAFTVKALKSGRRWARNAAIFWQLVQLTVAWGSFTGEFANPAIGVGLILPSLAVIILLFEKSVFAATQEEIPND